MERIGFIGLGIMGLPMSRNLLKAGFQVTGYNRSPEKIAKLVEAGGIAAGSPREVAENSDIILMILPSGATVEEVIFGENGVTAAARPGMVVIDMSTISPLDSKRFAAKLAEQSIDFLDAPVSGGEQGAIDGILSIMVGGKEAVYERCLPVFQAMGRTIVYAGESGAGQTIKACNQIVVAMNYVALSEALVLGSKAGVDPAKILQVLGGGLANSRVLELRGAKMAKHDFTPGGKVAFHHKDLGIISGLAKSLGIPLLATSLVEQMFTYLMLQGYHELDHSSVLLFVENLANHRVDQTLPVMQGLS